MNLSIILPTYNESGWLKTTVEKIDEAVTISGIKNTEVIIVDDGSCDETESVAADIMKSLKISVRYIKQENLGRFLARKRGVEAAKYDTLLFIDSRVHLQKKSLKYIMDRIKMHPNDKVWNAHVVVEKKNNMLASFWDVVTQIAWRRYFKKPTHVSYGIRDFDYFPKGTTCFLVDKLIFLNAINEFSTSSFDLKKANDDSLIIANIAKQANINIAPQFSCTYHARSTLKKFFSHAYHRGQVFEDGFLRRGNRYFAPLVMFLTFSLGFLTFAIFMPKILLFIPLIFLLFTLTCGLVSRLVRVPTIKWSDTVIFSIMSVPFAIFYGAGIWRAFIGRINNNYKNNIPHSIRNITGIAIAILFYTGLAAYYMSPVLTNCSSMVTESGDATGGLIPRNTLSPDNPLWGYTQKLNYPVGENLNQPTNYAAPLFYTTYWATSKVAGPVCGLNLLNLGGYVMTAVTMVLFVYWLIKKKWIALLAGYAVSYSPYFQSKVGGHPSYGYTALLITLLWLAVLVWQGKYKTKLFSSLLGVNLALLAYWDPYFVLLGAVLMLGFLISITIMLLYKGQARLLVGKILPRFVLAAGIMTILIIPLIYVRIHYSAAIDELVRNARSDIKAEVYTYSNRPVEYLLPAESNPIINRILGSDNDYQDEYHHKSNPGEYTVGLSITVILVVFCFLIIIAWQHLSKGKSKIDITRHDINSGQLLFVLFGLAVFAFFVALPPHYGPFRNITDYLTDYITMWRAFSRLYVVINIALVIIFSIVIAFFAKNIKSKLFVRAAYLAIVLLLFCEYQAYSYGTRYWSYNTSVSSVYYTLAKADDLTTLAEYPIDDKGTMINYYLTMQRVHGKALLNGITNTEQSTAIRNKVTNINDPQTILTLRELGIKAVTIHGPTDQKNISGMELLEEGVTRQGDTTLPIRLYRVIPANK